MSDVVIIAIFTTMAPVLTVIVTGIINRKQNSKENKHIVETVETYHKEVNGKMEKLLATTAELGREQGKNAEREREK